MKHFSLFFAFSTLTFSSLSWAAKTNPETLLSSKDFIRGIPASDILAVDESTKTAVLKASAINEALISKNAHLAGRCGGYEKIHGGQTPPATLLAELASLDLRKLAACSPNPQLIESTRVPVGQVSAANIESHVRWYSGFRTRYHQSRDANVPVLALQKRIQSLVANVAGVTAETISHQNTPQKSLRVVIPSTNSNAAPVVLGGHLDSINGWGFGDPGAPGADDNASGVGALVEAIRVLATQPQRLTHDIIVYLYAGEEAGLLGSAEIAQSTKRLGSAIRGILQLDMTLFPGDGPFVISSMTDFTDPRLRKWLGEFNSKVLNVKIIDDQCGYGCSDHASWHRQGYATLMPFESTFDSMNRNIHTSRDVVDTRSNFEHAAVFAKIAVGFAMSSPDTNNCRY